MTLSALRASCVVPAPPLHTICDLHCRYWSPINFTASELPFGDGGSVDNLAITPLLRRRIQKIVVLVAALKGVNDTVDAADWGGECAA